MSVLMRSEQFVGYNIQIIQHPTVESQKSNDPQVD